jgi:rRNA-processing protein FCF1
MKKHLTERIILNLPKEEFDIVSGVSDQLGISKSALVRSIVMSELNKNSGSEVKISSTALSQSIKLVKLKGLAKVR